MKNSQACQRGRRPGRFSELLVAALSMTVTIASADTEMLVAVPAPEWTALFDREHDWTGADGIFSIPLNGREDGEAHGPNFRTLILFSDTAIGEVGSSAERLDGTTLVNNTLAVLRGTEPRADRIEFLWGGKITGESAAVFVPETPMAQDGEWYWLGDGVAIGDLVHILAIRMRKTEDAVFGFATSGVNLLTLDLTRPHPLALQQQRDTPFFRAPEGDHGDLTFGSGILVNTEEAGAPNADGFIYVYGVRNDLSKKLMAARVRPDLFTNFDAWRFWDGGGWSAQLDDAAPITDQISNELSVSPLADGTYALVFQVGGITADVGVRFGDSPVGPFGDINTIYHASEPSTDPETFVYNAKAHPHLSKPGELLISYNVNTFDFYGDFFKDSDIYRPRFIRLKLVATGH